VAFRVSIDPNRNIDHAYEQYILGRGKSVTGAISKFEETLQQSFFKFGRFTIPAFFKAHFISRKQQRLLHGVGDTIAHTIDKLIELYLTEPVIKNLYPLSLEAEELIRIDPGYTRSAILCRLDCFLEGEAVQFLEFDCDAPGGMAYADTLEKIYFDQNELKEFFAEFDFERRVRCEKLLSALLNIYEEFGGFETPRIAIVDWNNVRTRSEFEVLKTFFEEKGYSTTIADPRDLRYKSGKLYHGNFRIDLVYRRVLFRELVEKMEDVKDLLKAYKDKAVCVVNPLRSAVGASKAMLSVLTNPAYDHFFTEKQNAIKREHIPWTRNVTDADRFFGGKKIYLVDFLKDEKDTLVIKPPYGYGGKDVTIGCETRNEDWNAAIDKAIKSNWTVQEYIKPAKMSVPVVINNKVEFVLKKMSTGCYVFDGSYAGSVSRLSDESVIKVSKGGGLIPSVTCEGEINR